MKKFSAFIIAIVMLAVSACSIQQTNAEDENMIIVCSGESSVATLKDFTTLDNLLEPSQFIIIGKIIDVPKASYTTLSGKKSQLPCGSIVMKINEIIWGGFKKGEELTLGWAAGYIPYKLYIQKQCFSPDKLGEDYKKYINNPNAYAEFHLGKVPILKKGETYIIIGETRKDGTSHGGRSMKITGGKVYETEYFKDGTPIAEVKEKILDILEQKAKS